MKLENNEICRIVDGDEIAFNRFMEHYSSRLYHYTFALLGQKESAEEIVSDVFFGVMWFSPGYQARMNGTDEMMYWLPQYQKWSLMKKIVEGYTTTVANIVYKDNSF